MNQFPLFVYRCPGPFVGPPRSTYKTLSVADQDALNAALADGWFATMPEAVDAYLNPAPERILAAVEEGQTFTDEAPPTREEMLAKAAELGLAVDKRWSDKTLAAKILEAMK